MHRQSQFAELKYSKKIWAVGSIHSHFDSFNSVKEHILKHFVCGDKLVFLGNIIGFGKRSTETLSSVINLRNYLFQNLKQQNLSNILSQLALVHQKKHDQDELRNLNILFQSLSVKENNLQAQ